MSDERGSETTVAQRLPVLVWLRLARVFQKMDHASSDALRRWNLNTAQFDVLALLGSANVPLLVLRERPGAAPVPLVIFGHDGKQWQTLKKLPDYYG